MPTQHPPINEMLRVNKMTREMISSIFLALVLFLIVVLTYSSLIILLRLRRRDIFESSFYYYLVKPQSGAAKNILENFFDPSYSM